jgi:hypothetical protein
MKKLSYLLGLLVVAGIMFSACSKDEENTDPPSLVFLGGEYEPGKDRVDGDVTLTVGTEFVFGITASKVSDQDLRKIEIRRIFENVSNILFVDSTINTASITFDIQVFAWTSPGTEDFVVTVYDKADKSSTISFTVTTEPAAPNITTYEDKILGSYESTTGSSFASIDGTVYTLADAINNAEAIDFMYFYGTTNLATLAAPDDDAAADVFDSEPNGLQNWSVLNATRFKETTLNSAAFDAITSSSQLVPVCILPTPPDQSRINNLAIGDVLAFETAGEHYGLIRIDAITGEAAGTIEITVKVQ